MNNSLLKVCLVFIITSFIFNKYSYDQAFIKQSTVPLNDTVVTETLNETSYDNLLAGKDPFETDKLFFPFKTDFTLNDSSFINLPFFLILRPFFASYNLLYLIVIVNSFLSYFLMYLLLKKLKLSDFISILGGLIFTFMPFLSQRIASGHLTYTTIYFFPLLTLIALSFIENKDPKKRQRQAIFFGLSLGLLFYANPHYFLSSLVALAAFFMLFLLKEKKLAILRQNFKFLAISLIFAFVMLLPIIGKLNNVRNFSSQNTFGSALTLSADLTSFFIPNYLNPLYRVGFEKIAQRNPFLSKLNEIFLNSDYSFAYPGLIILTTLLIFIIFRDKLKIKLESPINYFFGLALIFFFLSLGPLLKVFNKWSVDLDSVPFSIPLPFLLFKYVPVLNIIRAPIRFIPLFIFFATLVTAFVLNFLLTKVKKKNLRPYLIVLLAVFFIDQFYVIVSPPDQKIPFKIYETIKAAPSGTVLEIPFTIRDGLRYSGFVHAIQPMRGAILHEKPIIGGYLARVDSRVFEYYDKIIIIDYFEDVIDKGNYDPIREEPGPVKATNFRGDRTVAKKELEGLNIKYIVLKNNEEYTDEIVELVTSLEYKKKATDENYDLYVK